MPLAGERLVIETRYPQAEELSKIGAPTPKTDQLSNTKIRNKFWSCSKHSDILIFEHDGKIDWGIDPGIHHFGMDLRTLGCQEAWGIEQESNAVHTLAEIVSHRQFKQYMLVGMFLETSQRSHITYCFRRLRPTVALNTKGDSVTIMCTLCLHPIAYYSGSWAGAMTPTDDVIAHLMLMRGDEPMFWRRANQHAAYRPESGL